jgi:hypothetical protein
MAKFVLKNASVVINAVDLSDHCSKVTIETSFDSVDVTSFGATYKSIVQGMGDATMTFTFFQDYAAGSVDATLWPLSQSGNTFLCSVKPVNTTTSTTNPRYDMTGVLLSYNPLDGGVGDASSTDVSVPNASQAGLTRNTS